MCLVYQGKYKGLIAFYVGEVDDGKDYYGELGLCLLKGFTIFFSGRPLYA